MGSQGTHRKVANSLVALSSAAVLSVYAAGYVRTRAAAARFADQSDARRPLVIARSQVEAAGDGAPQVTTAGPASLAALTTPVATTAPPRQGSGAGTREHAAAAMARPRRNKARAIESTTVKSPGEASANAATVPVSSAVSTTVTTATGTPHDETAAATGNTGAEPPSVKTPAAAAVYRDGTYFGWGTSRHGDIQAAVVIENGRIASATIAQCLTRYSCNVIVRLPPQVSERQSPEVDYVSGATQSTNAFYYAVVEALGQAKAK